MIMACIPGSTSTLDFLFLFDPLLLGVVSLSATPWDSLIVIVFFGIVIDIEKVRGVGVSISISF